MNSCIRLLPALLAGACLGVGGTLVAAPYQMENLGRGVVAVRTSSTQVYVGWRLLGLDPAGTGFNLYRSANGGTAVKLNSSPLTGSTNYVDSTANLSQSNAYHVRPVIGGVEQAPSAAYTLPANAPTQNYVRVVLQRPSGGTTPTGESYTYTPNDCSVGDLDGDGEYEIVVKWEPTNAKDNSQDGYTGNVYLDGYKLDGTRLWRIDLGRNIRAGAHYTQYLVYDLDGDGRAEIACKTADATVSGAGQVIGNGSADYRNSAGRILSGPEYFTVFNGQTGAALATANYVVPRGTVSNWGDSYGNRVDRFLAGIAYLDGTRPSVVMCRGYYTRAVLAAWDWRNGSLTQRWVFDTGDSTSGPLAAYRGQGAHSLSVADVDGDGRQEIVYGACTIDDNGSGRYSTTLGHGDAEHVSDMNPNRPGLEIWMVHEDPDSYGPYGLELHDANNGAIIFGISGENADIGRGCAGDIDPRYLGYEMWGARGGLYSATGTLISSTRPSQMNFMVWWDADLRREILDGTTISKWNYTNSTSSTLLSPSGIASNNSTKATPCLSADILGDWREEVIWRESGNTAIRIYTTTNVASNRIYTLMHDPQYRAAIAWQNVGYNQPPHPGFYLGDGMSPAPAPSITYVGGGSGNNPPAVAVTAPVNGATFTAGASITITASASDSDGTVSSVAFYHESTLIGTDTTAPYSVTWTNVPADSYALTAVATDDDGAPTTSAAVNITVNPAGGGGSTTYQAEEASYGGGVTIDSNNAGFHGTGFANFPTSGGFLQFSGVDGGSGGTATLAIRYALGISSSRTGLLIVNGSSQNITFQPSGAWTTYTTMSLNISLTSGTSNTVRFESNGQDLANIDEITVTVSGGGGGGPVSGQSYRLVNVGSGLSLTVAGGSTSNGANVQQNNYSGANYQRWTLTDLGTGYWTLTAVHSGQNMDVSGASQADGANVLQWPDNNNGNQHWQVQDTGGGAYRLTAQHSGKVLTVTGSSNADGANVEQNTDSGSNYQRWQIVAP